MLRPGTRLRQMAIRGRAMAGVSAAWSPASLPGLLGDYPLDDGSGLVARNAAAATAPGVNLWQAPEQILARVLSVTGVTVTDNYGSVNSPAGDATATRLQFAAATGRLASLQSLSLPASTYTVSFYHRRTGGSDQTWRTFDGANNTFTPVTSTGEWQRFTQVIVVGSTLTTYYLYSDAAGNAADVLVWGLQIEAGGSATAYVRPQSHAAMPSGAALGWVSTGLRPASTTRYAAAIRPAPTTVSAMSVHMTYKQTATGDAVNNVLIADGTSFGSFWLYSAGYMPAVAISGSSAVTARFALADDGLWHTLSYTYDGTDSSLYWDGVLVRVFRQSGLSFTNKWYSLFAIGSNNPLLGIPADSGYVITADAAHTQDEVTEAVAYCKSSVSARGASFLTRTGLVLYEGDSITAGLLTTNPVTDIYPVLSRSSQPAGSLPSLFALSGSSIPAGSLNTSLTDRGPFVDTAFAGAGGGVKKLFVKVGTNDMSGGLSAAEFLVNLQTYVAARKAATPGLQVFVDTVPPRNDGISATFNPKALAANVGIRSGAGVWHDGTPDTQQDPLLSDATNATYYPDGVHWSTAAHAVAAPYFADFL